MTHNHGRVPAAPDETPGQPQEGGKGGSDHTMWWMLACCAPAVLLVIWLLFEFLVTR